MFKDDVKGDDLLNKMEQRAYYQQSSQDESPNYKQESTNRTVEEDYTEDITPLDKISLLHYVRS